MTKAQQKTAARLIHRLASIIKMSHGGWWEAYASVLDKQIVNLSKELKGGC